MKLHTVVVSYQRLPLLQETIRSYCSTVSVPYTLMVVDNGSDIDVCKWLAHQDYLTTVLLPENRYPGYATNRGFALAPGDATHLHRSDSDMEYLLGWCEEVERVFASDPSIAQVGLRTSEEEQGNVINVGGTMVLRRDLFDAGLRYREQPWTGPMTEDSYLSLDVRRRRFRWARVERPCVVHKGSGDLSDPYYRQSYGVRGIKT